MVTDFGYPRACSIVHSENKKLKIGYGLWQLSSQLFSKRDFYFIKCGKNWQKLTINGIFRFFLKSLIFECNILKLSLKSNVFHDLKNVKIAEKSLKIGQLLPILATFYEFKSRFEKS
jgi:hypothetical protein